MRCIGNPMVKCTPVFMWGHISSSIHFTQKLILLRKGKERMKIAKYMGMVSYIWLLMQNIYMYLRFMQNHHAHRKDQLRHFGKETWHYRRNTTTTNNINPHWHRINHQIYISCKLRRLRTGKMFLTLEKHSFFFPFSFLSFFFFFFPLPFVVFATNKMYGGCFHYSLCFTRLPLMSLPSRIASFPCLHTMTECSLTRATYSKSSVRTEGQLSFKYSKPSVCITAEKRKSRRSTSWLMTFTGKFMVVKIMKVITYVSSTHFRFYQTGLQKRLCSGNLQKFFPINVEILSTRPCSLWIFSFSLSLFFFNSVQTSTEKIFRFCKNKILEKTNM